MKHQTPLELTILPVLLIENTMLKAQSHIYQKRLFFSHLKQYAREDAIIGTEIAPLSRNEGPNISLFNAKSGSSSEVFNNLIQNFELISKNCHVCGWTLYKQYRQRVNDLQKYMIYLEGQKKKVEARQKQLTQKVKTLRFKTVPVSQVSSQTQTNVDQLIKRQINNMKTQYQHRTQFQQDAKQLQNKDNYLKYMQEIINNRQVDLDRKQSDLLELQRSLNQQDIRFKTQPLSHLIDSKRMYDYFCLIKDRIYDAVLKYQSGEPNILKLLENHPLYDLFQRYQQNNINPKLKFEILKLLEINTLEQRYKLEVSEDYFYSQCSKVEELKRHLQEKNIKFIQLNSYEHFLDRYRELLDQRQEALLGKTNLFRQQMRVIMQYLDIKSSQDQSESSFSFLQHIDKQTRGNSSGRGRIFTLRQRTNNIIQQYKYVKPELDKQFLSQKINRMKQDYGNQVSHQKRVSQLEQQNQQLKLQLSTRGNQRSYKMSKNDIIFEQQNFDIILQDAQKKKRIINVLTKLFKFSFFKNIKNPHFNKGLAWLVWRSRQYDPESYDRIKQLMTEEYAPSVEEIWKKRCTVLQKNKMFPYKSLSLKRKQFLQQFFDYERKQFFKDRLKALILSITRNKVRKQRMTYIVYFHRFVRNALLSTPRVKLQKTKQKQNIKTSSRTLKPVPNANSRATLSFDSNNTKRSSKIKDESTNHSGLQKCTQKQRAQYQKRYRKMLACSKLTHILRSFSQRQSQDIFRGFTMIKQRYCEQKIHQMQSLVDQISFDNNMFVTKFNICQSSLTSKMSLLQQLLTIVPK